MSVGFNVVHSPGDLVSKATHAIPPITLMFSIEMFTMIIRSDLNRSGTVPSPVPVPMVQNVTIPDVTLMEQKRKVTDAEVLQFFRCNKEATYMEAAESLQVARQTVSRKVSRLVEEGKIVREGRELVVVSDSEWAPEVA